MDAATLRQRIEFEEFDYQALLDALRDYAHPRDKVTRLLRKGVILRIKKGLYVFGSGLRKRPVSREVLANLIYGPSYISMEYALQFHGLIPEAVEEVTSVTTGRSRRFSTPLGMFSYRRISLAGFRMGMDRVALPDGRSFLMATPEKALADKVVADRAGDLRSQAALLEYLVEDLRTDAERLKFLDPDRLATLARALRSRRVRLLSALVGRLVRKEKKRS